LSPVRTTRLPPACSENKNADFKMDAKTVPQGLKPLRFLRLYGATKIVPFQGREFFAACEGPRYTGTQRSAV